LAELCLEAALAAQSLQLTRAGPWDDEPGAGDSCAPQRPLVVEDERSCLPADACAHPLDTDEARLVPATGRLQELGYTLALDVSGESSTTWIRTSAGPSVGWSYAVGSYTFTLIFPLACVRFPLVAVTWASS
jgi:hypothetical protein